MDDLAIAFAMRCDQQGFTFEAGQKAAEDLAAELAEVADDRASYAVRENEEGQ